MSLNSQDYNKNGKKFTLSVIMFSEIKIKAKTLWIFRKELVILCFIAIHFSDFLLISEIQII